MFYYIHQQEVLFFYFVLFLITLTLLEFGNASLRSNYGRPESRPYFLTALATQSRNLKKGHLSFILTEEG